MCQSHCSGLSHILPTSCSLFCDESLYNFYSLHIRQCNILPASHLLLASHLHTHAYLTHKLLTYCLRVAHKSLVSCSRVAHESLTCNSWALVTLQLSDTIAIKVIIFLWLNLFFYIMVCYAYPYTCVHT